MRFITVLNRSNRDEHRTGNICLLVRALWTTAWDLCLDRLHRITPPISTDKSTPFEPDRYVCISIDHTNANKRMMSCALPEDGCQFSMLWRPPRYARSSPSFRALTILTNRISRPKASAAAAHLQQLHISQQHTSCKPDLVLPLPVPPLSLPLAPFFPLPPLLASRTPPPFASSPFGHTHKRAHPRLPTLGKGAYLAAIHQGLQGHFGGEACTGSSWSCLYRTRAGLLVLSYQYT